jgi:electron-transferring-flavoprotein dehydrogenase
MVGFVVHLNYKNPYVCRRSRNSSASRRIHPIAALSKGGKRIVLWCARDHRRRLPVGAETDLSGRRAGRLCAGFVNVPRIKGSHNAILTGIMAAEHRQQSAGSRPCQRDELTVYEQGWRDSQVGADLKKVRNVKPLWSKFGT